MRKINIYNNIKHKNLIYDKIRKLNYSPFEQNVAFKNVMFF